MYLHVIFLIAFDEVMRTYYQEITDAEERQGRGELLRDCTDYLVVSLA
jgi:hypothetical protein